MEDNSFVFDIGLGIAAAVIARVALVEGVHKSLNSDPALLEIKKRKAARTAAIGVVTTIIIYHVFEKQLEALDRGEDPAKVMEDYLNETA
jgi:predicted small secreted protein